MDITALLAPSPAPGGRASPETGRAGDGDFAQTLDAASTRLTQAGGGPLSPSPSPSSQAAASEASGTGDRLARALLALTGSRNPDAGDLADTGLDGDELVAALSEQMSRDDNGNGGLVLNPLTGAGAGDAAGALPQARLPEALVQQARELGWPQPTTTARQDGQARDALKAAPMAAALEPGKLDPSTLDPNRLDPTRFDPARPVTGVRPTADAGSFDLNLPGRGDGAVMSGHSSVAQSGPSAGQPLSAGAPLSASLTASLQAPVGSQPWQQELGQQMVGLTQRGGQTMELRLHPADLGPLSVSLKVDDHGAQAQFFSAHAQVRGAVEQAIPQLRDALAEQGIALGDTQVGDQPAGQFADGNGADGKGQTGPDVGSHELSLEETPNDMTPTRTVEMGRPGGVDLYA